MEALPEPVPLPPGWLPAGAVGVARPIAGPAPAILAAERPAVARAVEVRAREFAFGRGCARQVLVELGVAGEIAIPARADRTPAFPAGIAASISHTRALAVAVGAPASAYGAIGVDVELVRPLSADVIAVVTTPSERALGAGDPAVAARWFGAKEAVYKCWYTAGGGRILEFDEVDVDLRPDGQLVVLRMPAPVIPLTGRWATAHGHHWSIVTAIGEARGTR